MAKKTACSRFMICFLTVNALGWFLVFLAKEEIDLDARCDCENEEDEENTKRRPLFTPQVRGAPGKVRKNNAQQGDRD